MEQHHNWMQVDDNNISKTTTVHHPRQVIQTDALLAICGALPVVDLSQSYSLVRKTFLPILSPWTSTTYSIQENLDISMSLGGRPSFLHMYNEFISITAYVGKWTYIHMATSKHPLQQLLWTPTCFLACALLDLLVLELFLDPESCLSVIGSRFSLGIDLHTTAWLHASPPLDVVKNSLEYYGVQLLSSFVFQ